MQSKNKFNAFIFILIFAITLSYGLSYSQNDIWPQFRGPNCSGHAAKNAKPPIELNEGNMRWKTALPSGHSSPVVWGENIFLSSGDKEQKKLDMFCINSQSGEIKWQKSLNIEKIEQLHPVGNPAQPSPATDGNFVYFYFGSYGLQCYDFAGKLIWEHKMPVTTAGFGVASSPVIVEDKLILCRDVSSERKLYAFNKHTGDSLWVTPLPAADDFNSPSHSTPIIVGEHIILHRAWGASAYSLKNGERQWWFPMPTNGNSTPIIGDNVLFFGAWTELSEPDQRGELPKFNVMIQKYDTDGDGFIKQEEIPADMLFFERPEIRDVQHPWYLKGFLGWFDPNKDGLSNEEEWNKTVEWILSFSQDGGLFAIRPEGENELPLKQMLWKVKEKVPEVPSPIYLNSNIYMCKNGGTLTCVNAKEGNILYRERIGASGPYYASTVAANGNIYIASGKGMITVIRAGDKLDIIAQYDLKEPIFATPAIVGNTIYIRTNANLYAFGKK